MTVKVVTDSGADIPEEILKELEIETVPYLVQFGLDTFRDGIDIKAEEIYRLLKEEINLTTSAPFPKDFIKVYQKYGEDGIISIHLSGKLSATYDSALLAKAIVEEEKKCHIEVIDSQAVVMGIGLLAILAAKTAKAGKGLEEIVKIVKDAIPKVHLIGVLDTLEYAFKGGRLGKAAILLGPIKKASETLKIKPVLILNDGEIKPGGILRSHKKKERLLKFIQSFPKVKEVAVEYATAENRGEAENLFDTIKSLFPGVSLYLSQISSVLGVHSGPGALVVALREE